MNARQSEFLVTVLAAQEQALAVAKICVARVDALIDFVKDYRAELNKILMVAETTAETARDLIARALAEDKPGGGEKS